MSRVLALSSKAQHLANVDGHYGRAATKFAAAAEAARALGPAAGDDCLVATTLQVHQVDALVMHFWTCKLPTADAADALHLAFFTLLPAAQRALLRRKAAGTLLGGTCRAHEVAWQVANQRSLSGMFSRPVEWSTRSLHVGYDAFLMAAQCSVNMVMLNKESSILSGAADVANHLAFVSDGLKLMATPRRGRAGSPALTADDVAWTGPEASIVRGMQNLLARDSLINSDKFAEVLAAWRALQRSGALEERRVLSDGVPTTRRETNRIVETAAAAAAPERLRACALGSCGVRETYPAQHKLCGACAAVVYCCREHQLADWPVHKAGLQSGLQGGARRQGRREAALMPQRVLHGAHGSSHFPLARRRTAHRRVLT